MKFFMTSLEMYINTSIHVALAVVSLSLITYFEFEIPLNVDLLLLIFFGTIVGYNFVKFGGMARRNYFGLAKNLKVIQILTLLSLFFTVFLLSKQDGNVIFTLIILGILTFFYAMPFYRGSLNLRNTNGLKVFVIAIVWAGVTVVLPVLNEAGINFQDIILSFIQRFLFVIVLMLPFEIRDLEYDNESLGTIPQQIGVKKSKILGYILLIVLLFLEWLKQTTGSQDLMVLALVCGITAIFVLNANKKQHKFYASLWVESIPIIWLLLWGVSDFWF